MCKIAQVPSPKSDGKIASSIAIRWLTVQYCVITFSNAESDTSDFTVVLPVQIRIETITLFFCLFPWTIRCRLCDHIHQSD